MPVGVAAFDRWRRIHSADRNTVRLAQPARARTRCGQRSPRGIPAWPKFSTSRPPGSTPGNPVPAVNRLNLDVADGEFVVLVGPSGSGKSTALRMLAGLEDVDQGEIRIGGVDVSQKPPKDRDIAMVFQNYALYPHMSVAENMGFALKLKGVSKEERAAKVLRRGQAARPRAVPGPQAQGAVRWPAPARRDGPGDRPRAQRVPDGRAAVQPRRQAAGRDPRQHRRAAGPARHDHHLRHPRPGRGHDDGRPGGAAQGRHPAAGRHPAQPVRPARQRLRRRLHRLAGDEPAQGRRSPRPARSSATWSSRSSRTPRPRPGRPA